ncbi:OmpA family protein [Sphingobacterium sp. SYP-B4668]|uniref:OmpA family protein n=1 Tax=Sphingobacterium sp. SYP-B4668 TaxID=2996035 RepID=UPI0022DD64E4|nr:OmpA family protein [Sphingobacterium sp. SYP-B4668]
MKNSMFRGLVVSVAWISMLANISMEASAQSILKKIKGRVENATTQKVLEQTDRAVNKGMDKVLESAEKGNPKKETEESAEPGKMKNENEENARKPISSFSKYDFIPGDTVLYANDFSTEALGELPAGWNSSRSSVIVSLENIPGKWLRLAQNSVSLTDNEKLLGSDFTVEFDLVMDIDFKGWLPPSLQFGLLASGTESSSSNKLLVDPKGIKSFYMEVSPLSDAGNIILESHIGYIRHFHSPPDRNTIVKSWYGRPVHVAIQGQRERLRIWVDGEKLFDVPKGIAKEGTMNQLFFRLGSSPYKDDQIGVFIGDVKIAKGAVDTRRRLLEEGRFATTGILFETASASIKPESAGVLRSIASVLEQDPAISLNVVGHTDGIGDEGSNLSLSTRRAEAVKDWLVNKAGVSNERLKTEGKGETEPVSENSTASGRAQNRRVEFIKT